MSAGKNAVPAVSAISVLAAVPAALHGMAASAPAGHPAPAVLDARVVLEMPRARMLVTRIVSASAQKSYTVIAGDTLSGIAGRHCLNAAAWPALWHGNQAEVPDPNLIYPGQVLQLTCQELAAALADPPPAASGGKVWGVTYGDPYFCGDGDGDGYDEPCSKVFPSSDSAPADPAPVAAVITGASGIVSTAGMSAFEQCVISRESGGNAQVMNSSGHYGLFQFSASTWAAYGGNPADFGHASAAEQEAVFNTAMATPAGASNWSPYDGC